MTLKSAQELFALQPQWDDLHRRTGAPVSMSSTWLSTWWSVFGHRFTIYSLAAWEGERLVALFPCFIERLSAMGIRTSRMRFLGEYSILAEYHPLVDPEVEKEFAEIAADFCAGSLRDGVCDLVDVHAFPYDLPFMQRWIGAMRGRRVVMTVRDREVPRIRIDLPRTEQEYLTMISAGERRGLRKKERILQNAGAEVQCVTDPGDRTAFQDYVRLSISLWERRGGASYFSIREGFTRFQEEVTTRMLGKGEARLYFLQQSGQRFAAIQAFVSNGIFQAYLGGRDPDHPLAHWSPGLVLMVHAVKDAIRSGCTQFDFLTGDHPYKHSLGGTVHGWHGRVTASCRGLRGWKGILMIMAHNSAMWAGQRLRARRVIKLFDRLSAAAKGSTTES